MDTNQHLKDYLELNWEQPDYDPVEVIDCEICGEKVNIYAWANGPDDYYTGGYCKSCGEDYQS